MSKFHISKAGKPVLCHALPGECPLGDMEHHYDSKEEAMHAIEESLAQKADIMNPWISNKTKKKNNEKEQEPKENKKTLNTESLESSNQKNQSFDQNKVIKEENKIKELTKDKKENSIGTKENDIISKVRITGPPEQIAKRPEIDILVRQLPMSANGDITLKHSELISMVLSSKNIEITPEEIHKASKYVKREDRVGEIQEELIELSNKKGYKLFSLNGAEIVMGKEKDVAKHPIVSEVISEFSYIDKNNKLYLEDESAKMVYDILREQGIDAGKADFLKKVAPFVKKDITKRDIIKMRAIMESKRRDGLKKIMLLQELRSIEENNKWMRQESKPLYY